jgi:hypothetical protein
MARPALPEDRDPLRADLLRGEEGMLSLASLFAVLGLLLLIGLLANVGRTTNRKLEVQNAADAVGHAAAVEMARGCNSVTAANHLAGELTALVILHHGFGGDELDNGRRPPATPVDLRVGLEVSYRIADLAASLGSVAKPIGQAYEQVKKEPQVGGAIRDARLRLKQVLTWAYTAHAIGAFLAALLEKIPVIGPILSAIVHVAIIIPAMVFEGKALQESYTLDALEYLAKAVAPVKKSLVSAFVPGLHRYSQLVVLQAPLQMEKAAEEVGTRNGATGRLYPGLKNFSLPLLQMPVTQEPAQPRRWQHSQLVRASTPWVQHWRVPVLQFGEDALLLSRFKCAYWDRTDEYTKTMTDRLRKDHSVRLYIVEGWTPDGTAKGRETWTRADGSREADKLFCVLGFAHRPAPTVTSFGIFRQANPHGTAAYAQGMAYNANPQSPGGSSAYQPQVGWDTLNWDNRVREFPGERPRDDSYPVPTVEEPRVRVNWQAKLVPTTRLAESIWWQKDDLGRVLRHTPPFHIDLTGAH